MDTALLPQRDTNIHTNRYNGRIGKEGSWKLSHTNIKRYTLTENNKKHEKHQQTLSLTQT